MRMKIVLKIYQIRISMIFLFPSFAIINEIVFHMFTFSSSSSFVVFLRFILHTYFGIARGQIKRKQQQQQ